MFLIFGSASAPGYVVAKFHRLRRWLCRPNVENASIHEQLLSMADAPAVDQAVIINNTQCSIDSTRPWFKQSLSASMQLETSKQHEEHDDEPSSLSFTNI